MLVMQAWMCNNKGMCLRVEVSVPTTCSSLPPSIFKGIMAHKREWIMLSKSLYSNSASIFLLTKSMQIKDNPSGYVKDLFNSKTYNLVLLIEWSLVNLCFQWVMIELESTPRWWARLGDGWRVITPYEASSHLLRRWRGENKLEGYVLRIFISLVETQ